MLDANGIHQLMLLSPQSKFLGICLYVFSMKNVLADVDSPSPENDASELYSKLKKGFVGST